MNVIKLHNKNNLLKDQWYGLITDTINEYLYENIKSIVDKGYCNGTYIVKYDTNLLSIRFPGATRGYIKLDNDIITEIKFYSDTCSGIIGVYVDKVKDSCNKYIGCKIIFE